MLSPLERAERFVQQGASGACWPWQGFRDRDGYGQFSSSWSGTMSCYRGHRVMWEALHGPIPPGLVLDHLCRNRACCNPAHLEPVTHHENIMRGEGRAATNASATHCVHGHPFTPHNTYRRGRKGGGRVCKTCVYERAGRAGPYSRGGESHGATSLSTD